MCLWLWLNDAWHSTGIMYWCAWDGSKRVCMCVWALSLFGKFPCFLTDCVLIDSVAECYIFTDCIFKMLSYRIILLVECKILKLSFGCGSEGRAIFQWLEGFCFNIRRFSQHVKCPWARYWTPNCWWCCVISEWACVLWCKKDFQWSKSLEKCHINSRHLWFIFICFVISRLQKLWLT